MMQKIMVATATPDQINYLVTKLECALNDSSLACTVQPIPSYATDPALADPIIERENIAIASHDEDRWQAYVERTDAASDFWCSGPTVLLAGMRCYALSKLGVTAEVPEELV